LNFFVPSELMASSSMRCRRVVPQYQQLNQLNIMLEQFYRNAFKIHQIQWFCGRLDFKHAVDKRKLLFLEGVNKVTDTVLQTCI